ncbi:hypothetical protein JOD54_000419 [Actinokineospora baliensis]|nr:hypothetical protein [Actinokineospora baliensis]
MAKCRGWLGGLWTTRRKRAGVVIGFRLRRRIFGSSLRDIALDPRFECRLDAVDLFCVGPLRQPWQDRKSRGRKAWPCSEARLRLTSPHTKQVHPIEQLAPATPSVQWLLWVGWLGGLGWHQRLPSVQWLAMRSGRAGGRDGAGRAGRAGRRRRPARDEGPDRVVGPFA